VCEEQLTYLSSQLATLDPDCYYVVDYGAFCARPDSFANALAELCGLPLEAILRGIRRERVEKGRDEVWRHSLGPAEKELLNQYFDARRLSQWPTLCSSRPGEL